MVKILFPFLAGSALILLGRWMYKNPRKFHANSLYTNPRHPFLLAYGRFFASFIIFAGSLAIIAALVSQRLPGSLAFFASLAGGIAGALFLRPRVGELVSPSAGNTLSTLAPVKRSFLSKKGKRAVGILLGIAFLFVIGAAGFVVNVIGNSEVCRLAVQQAQSNSVVAERLGQPIKRGLLVGGSINLYGSSGSANLGIPLSGPRGAGILYAVAVRSVGVWKLETLQLAVRGDSNRLDLLSGPVPSR
jgi:hypothetical protein